MRPDGRPDAADPAGQGVVEDRLGRLGGQAPALGRAADLSFEAENRILRDLAYDGDAVDCYASQLRSTFRSALAAAGAGAPSADSGFAGARVGIASGAGSGAARPAWPGMDRILDDLAADAAAAAPGPTDVESTYRAAAIDALRRRPESARHLASAEGVTWGRVQAWLAQAALPEEVVGNRFEWARPVVLPPLVALLGPQGVGWRTESRPHPNRPGAPQAWIHRTEKAEPVNPPPPPEDNPEEVPPRFPSLCASA